MLKKLGLKVRRGSRKKSEDGAPISPGAAVPYSDLADANDPSRRESNTDELINAAVKAHSPSPQKKTK